jgi:hypothetical protein
VWCAVAGVTSAVIGGHWDISWHRSIGRDTFWTPAHMAIYLCGILAGVSSGRLILASTFGGSRKDKPTVSVLGFRGPLGAFVCAWGGFAMLTAAPFDDWWHNAYGLDVKILSPPHTVLAGGIFAVHLGALLLVLSEQNRAGTDRSLARWLLVYMGGLCLVSIVMFLMEVTFRRRMHTAGFYQTAAYSLPFLMVAVPRAARTRWATTWMASIYTVLTLAIMWILPLFPAEPKLGPVYVHVTHFVPPPFPLFILPAAVAMDLVRARWNEARPIVLAIALGIGFLAVYAIAQWLLADFLMTPASRNWIFATDEIDFNAPPRWLTLRNHFSPTEHGLELASRLGVAALASVALSRAGLAAGDFMRRIVR